MDSFANQSEYQILCKDHLKDWQFSWLPLQRHVCYKRHWIPQCHWKEWWRCRSAWLEQDACVSAHLPLTAAEQSTATYTGKERKAKVKQRIWRRIFIAALFIYSLPTPHRVCNILPPSTSNRKGFYWRICYLENRNWSTSAYYFKHINTSKLSTKWDMYY